MRFELVSNWKDLLPLRESWNALVSKAQTASIFQTFEWHEAWVAAFNPSLRVVLGFQNEELKLIAPLCVEHDIRYGETLKFIGTSNYATDYADFIFEKGHTENLATLFKFIYALDWKVLDLFNLTEDSPSRELTEQFASSFGLACIARRLYGAPTAFLNDPDKAKELVNKESLRRHSKNLMKRGQVQFRHLIERTAIAHLLPDFFKQHTERREAAQDRSLFDDARNRKFYQNLVNTLDPKKELRFAVLSLDGEPIAFHFGFEFDSRLIWYKPSFAQKLSRQSPGEVLIKYLLEYAIDKKLAEFDFAVGDEAFKLRFASKVRSMYRVTIFRRKLDQQLERWVHFGRRVKYRLLQILDWK